MGTAFRLPMLRRAGTRLAHKSNAFWRARPTTWSCPRTLSTQKIYGHLSPLLHPVLRGGQRSFNHQAPLRYATNAVPSPNPSKDSDEAEKPEKVGQIRLMFRKYGSSLWPHMGQFTSLHSAHYTVHTPPACCLLVMLQTHPMVGMQSTRCWCTWIG